MSNIETTRQTAASLGVESAGGIAEGLKDGCGGHSIGAGAASSSLLAINTAASLSSLSPAEGR